MLRQSNITNNTWIILMKIGNNSQLQVGGYYYVKLNQGERSWGIRLLSIADCLVIARQQGIMTMNSIGKIKLLI